ncbi:WxcM-like domain-containing protein [Tahibacter soli]|uniref:WxcM-like domain-containing protein n=1 Tax=Tahibacter soli TaxID=2983605 RepID=A0A9X3YFP9_9GAMM|nr:WxcM-like domain-containing protein [Tahibacter soli]MDC8011106.1 WxcM-like domain-containing protein [Tahibacter soli]
MTADFFVHPLGCCESVAIGPRTRVWAFAHVLPGARIGADCNICDHVFVENDVVVGDRVTVKCGVQLWDGLRVEDDVFIGPNATFTNDRFPRSKEYPETFAQTHVGRGASIGANATILPGVSIGQYAMVGAGAVVTRSVPPHAIVVGNPARITGYVESHAQTRGSATEATAFPAEPGTVATAVAGVTLHRLKQVKDLRGSLSVGEFPTDIPFNAERYFLVYDVPSAETRGEHAHLACHQFLVCVKGSCAVVADDGSRRQEFLLDRPELGIHLPPMVWGIQYKYSPDAVLLVFASHRYDAADYVRDYDRFLALSRPTPS